jgi:predicted amidohydrolase YtcJ
MRSRFSSKRSWAASLLTLAMVCMAVVSSRAQQTVTVPAVVVSYADMVVYNGKVVTMDDTSLKPEVGKVVQAMAIRDGKILALGTDAEILQYAGPKTEKIDLKGRTLIPGIMDSHTHIHNNAVSDYAKKHPEILLSVSRSFNVAGKDYNELRKGIELVLKENMANAPKDQWAYISLPTGGNSGLGIGPKFLQERGITRADLDKLAPDNPVFVQSHPVYTVNSAAIKKIGDIYQSDPEEAMGLQGMDKQGLGDLTEYSRSLAVDMFFHDKLDLLADVIEPELERNAALGITTYSSHMVGLVYMDAFMRLVRQNRMPIRFAYTHYFGFEGNSNPSAFYLRLGDMAGLGTPYFWQSGVGLQNIDGGPPTICTSMEAPAEVKAREWCRVEPGNTFAKAIYTAIRSRHRLTIGHSYGDKGVSNIMDIIDQVMKDDHSITKDYIRSRRFSSDHCGFYPRPEQLPRMKDFNWIVSCNGAFINRSTPYLKIYGEKYGSWISPARKTLDAGVLMVYENEESWNHPSGNPNTYFGSAVLLVTRKNNEGNVIGPEQRVDRVTLMKMMTTWQAQFFQKESELGWLAPGKLADFVVLNKDYFTVPEEEIASTYPEMTVVGGKTIFLRDSYAKQLGRDKGIGPQIKFVNVPKTDPNRADVPDTPVKED